MPQHIRKGDLVMVTAGDNRGQTGRVKQVFPQENRVLIEGVNVHKRHMRPTQANPRGAVINKELPVHMSNVSPVVDGKPTRVRFQTKPDGSKVRVAARGGSVIGDPLRKAKG